MRCRRSLPRSRPNGKTRRADALARSSQPTNCTLWGNVRRDAPGVRGSLKAPRSPLDAIMDDSDPASTAVRGERGAPRLLSATLYCDNCGHATPHRILRLDRRAPSSAPRVRGVARCRECRFTHPFDHAPEERVEVALIVSEGPTSERRRHALPRLRKVQVGSGVPETDGLLIVHRIDDRSGRSRSSALAGEIGTVWASRDVGAVVSVSVVEGRTTVPVRLTLPHGTLLRIGDPLRLDAATVEIVGLRARGRTWRRRGDAFSADEVGRVYARRTSSPPAGRRPWSRVRVSPSSRARATSTASRSRSAPGTRTTRTVPRDPTADGGAAVHSVSPR